MAKVSNNYREKNASIIAAVMGVVSCLNCFSDHGRSAGGGPTHGAFLITSPSPDASYYLKVTSDDLKVTTDELKITTDDRNSSADDLSQQTTLISRQMTLKVTTDDVKLTADDVKITRDDVRVTTNDFRIHWSNWARKLLLSLFLPIGMEMVTRSNRPM